MTGHEPVLFNEAMMALAPRPGGRYIDATVGAGGHARGILERCSPDGRLLGVDQDAQALDTARQALAAYEPRVTLVHGNFARLGTLACQYGFYPADGVLFDLGVSTMQLSDAARGFAFSLEGPLDMRMDRTAETTAADLVNTLSEADLADILYRYGEERMSRRIARAIVRARPLRTTTELAGVVARAIGRRGRIHPATRTFQALRIVVNKELEALAQGLEAALDVLGPGGRVVVISFHSLEDRLTKQYFRQEQGKSPPTLHVLTRKPVRPTISEQQRNPRSRSAKLRAAEKR